MHKYHIDKRLNEDSAEIHGLLMEHEDFVVFFFFSFPSEICRSCYTNSGDLHNFWSAVK
jgi:hypothetical protein